MLMMVMMMWRRRKILMIFTNVSKGVSLRSCKLLTRAYYSLLRWFLAILTMSLYLSLSLVIIAKGTRANVHRVHSLFCPDPRGKMVIPDFFLLPSIWSEMFCFSFLGRILSWTGQLWYRQIGNRWKNYSCPSPVFLNLTSYSIIIDIPWLLSLTQLRNIVDGYSALVRSLNDELMVELMRKVMIL